MVTSWCICVALALVVLALIADRLRSRPYRESFEPDSTALRPGISFVQSDEQGHMSVLSSDVIANELKRLASELNGAIEASEKKLRKEIADSVANSVSDAKRRFVGYDDEIAISGIGGCGPEPGRFLTTQMTMVDKEAASNHRWSIRRRCGGCDANSCNPKTCIQTNPLRRGREQPAC